MVCITKSPGGAGAECLTPELFVLTLRKLSLLTCTLESELLAFALAWVTAEQVSTLQSVLKVFVDDN